MGIVRVLTVRQPWAWAIIHGGKDVENRVRNVAGAYRGPVAIHAALGVGTDQEFLDNTDRVARLGPPVPFGLAYGAIIGVVDLGGTHLGSRRPDCCWYDDRGMQDRCSPWGESDRFHLELANPRAMEQTLAWTGGLGLRKAPQLDVVGDWLAMAAEGCTCGQAGVGGPHEPACGWEPLTRLIPTGARS